MTRLTAREEILAVHDSLSHLLRGKEKALRFCLIALLSEGHILLEDIPGVGKTTLALALAGALGLSFGRVQCTSDLLPSDLTGLSVYSRDEGRFKFIRGPLFNNVILVDEINRAMPKTQSALLEAMEEGRVTVEGSTYDLPSPFLVVATQNPVEQVGTYPLPESQLDRFLVRTGIGYPPEAMEKEIIRGGSIRTEVAQVEPLVAPDEIVAARRAVRSEVYVSEKIVEYIYRIAEATRTHPLILTGISPRGSISIADASRAEAYLEGRDFVQPEDVQKVSAAVVPHRLIVRGENESLDKEQLFASILDTIPVPLV